jgi:hypothetical protein
LQARATDKATTAGAPPAPTTTATATTTTTSDTVAQTAPSPSIFSTIGDAFKPTIGPRGAIHDSFATSMLKSATRAASSQMGRQVIRGILGSFMGGGSRR